MLKWPWKRFDRFFEKLLIREGAEMLERRRLAMVTGFWSNDGMNDSEEEKGIRERALAELDEQFDEVIERLRSGKVEDDDEDDESWKENPFIKPAIEATRKLDSLVTGEDVRQVSALAEAKTDQD